MTKCNKILFTKSYKNKPCFIIEPILKRNCTANLLQNYFNLFSGTKSHLLFSVIASINGNVYSQLRQISVITLHLENLTFHISDMPACYSLGINPNINAVRSH